MEAKYSKRMIQKLTALKFKDLIDLKKKCEVCNREEIAKLEEIIKYFNEISDNQLFAEYIHQRFCISYKCRFRSHLESYKIWTKKWKDPNSVQGQYLALANKLLKETNIDTIFNIWDIMADFNHSIDDGDM